MLTLYGKTKGFPKNRAGDETEIVTEMFSLSALLYLAHGDGNRDGAKNNGGKRAGGLPATGNRRSLPLLVPLSLTT